MWMQKLLQGLNFNLARQMEEEERQTDPLCHRPENWYQGPLIFPTFPEEGVTMYSQEGPGEVET